MEQTLTQPIMPAGGWKNLLLGILAATLLAFALFATDSCQQEDEDFWGDLPHDRSPDE